MHSRFGLAAASAPAIRLRMFLLLGRAAVPARAAIRISPSFSALGGGGTLELWPDERIDERAVPSWWRAATGLSTAGRILQK